MQIYSKPKITRPQEEKKGLWLYRFPGKASFIEVSVAFIYVKHVKVETFVSRSCCFPLLMQWSYSDLCMFV